MYRVSRKKHRFPCDRDPSIPTGVGCELEGEVEGVTAWPGPASAKTRPPVREVVDVARGAELGSARGVLSGGSGPWVEG
jgi:hypothetical protein